MTKKTSSPIMLGAIWLIVIVSGFYLAWTLNAAFFSKISSMDEFVLKILSVTKLGTFGVNYAQRSTEALLVLLALLSISCIFLSFFFTPRGKKKWQGFFIPFFCFPFLFYMGAYIIRFFIEHGIPSGVGIHVIYKYSRYGNTINAILAEAFDGIWYNENRWLIFVASIAFIALIIRAWQSRKQPSASAK